MDTQNAIDLLKRGKDAWNAWATGKLAQRQALLAAGKLGSNEAKQLEQEANVTLAQRFQASAGSDWSELVMPGNLIIKNLDEDQRIYFPRVAVHGDLRIEGGMRALSFAGARLHGEAVFTNTNVHGDMDFVGARFHKRARFVGGSAAGEVDLSTAAFDGEVVLKNFDFTKDIKMRAAKFSGGAQFAEVRVHGNADLHEAVFSGEVMLGKMSVSGHFNCGKLRAEGLFDLTEVELRGPVMLGQSVFLEGVRFAGAAFRRGVMARDAVFEKSVDFHRAKLCGGQFDGVTFVGPASFDGSIFEKNVSFCRARFVSDLSLQGAKFEGAADFEDAQFGGEAVFRDINVANRKAFSFIGARFQRAPEFFEAEFKEPPRFDRAIVRPLGYFERPLDQHEAARYRKLKQYAIDRHDSAQELQFLAGEMRARRYYEDHWFGRNAARFWLGLMYDVLSDFGRSLSRPLLFWGASTVMFMAAYLLLGRGTPLLRCVGGGNGNALVKAAYLSVTNALFFGIGKGQEIASSYTCLYGGNAAAPVVPELVAFLVLGQTTVSATLLFLFFLAVRNHFKIR